ncbi:GRB10-interacting GYF protein 2-like isoform X2 [Takifugu flavidus]|uniref:GRB10-interacting GYF protein 2-like isoform X2 n=1 Tax=Takifugu flavidus TaxID=433684 RepID=UPI0025448337|nr:GRB10-interacting GYF protein 2-like isoform X2 [Takifugu flavidus]XP_056873513.1 GRB10-interacting GYF protein 2-like isoform X2 [Takifugu flavidus]
MTQRGTQQLKQESSMETWREEVQHLREALAEKEEQLSRAVKRRQMRTVAHVEALTLLNRTQAALKESELKCASLEETLHSQQQENEETHRRELMEQEEGLNQKLLVIQEEFERKLQEERQRSHEEKEAMRQQLFLEEKKFQKVLDDEKQKYNEKILQKEELMKQQLVVKEENFNRMLADVHQRWERTAQTWFQMNEELEHKINESQRFRQHEEAKNKEELQRLSEAILQLELQVSKKREKKGFCRWIQKKMRFWKK